MNIVNLLSDNRGSDNGGSYCTVIFFFQIVAIFRILVVVIFTKLSGVIYYKWCRD